MAKQKQTPLKVVKIEKSGNRFNAWDTDGVKRTSEITVGARQKAADGNYLLGRFINKAGKAYWKRWDYYLNKAKVYCKKILLFVGFFWLAYYEIQDDCWQLDNFDHVEKML